jgi:23S rRNA (pseudouridine1915-N3)-methyltransferase
MLRFNLLWIGKTREQWIRQGIDEYVGRLSHYLQVNITEIRERARPGKRSPSGVMKMEAEQILKALPKGNVHVAALDCKGRKFTSEGLAGFLSRLEDDGYREVCWITGGAYGLDRSILQRADSAISLSDMTFTHEMARVILAEQLYRACTIRKGEKYHH